jgi:hypothetical protein
MNYHTTYHKRSDGAFMPEERVRQVQVLHGGVMSKQALADGEETILS